MKRWVGLGVVAYNRISMANAIVTKTATGFLKPESAVLLEARPLSPR